MRLTMTISNNQITEQILELMRRDDSVDAPGDSVKWAKNIFRSRMVNSKAPIAQRILAVLRMDLAPNKTAFGERSAGVGQARQMLFDAGDNSIDLRINETGGAFEIQGQVLGEGFAGGSLELAGNENNYKTAVSEMSEFKLTGIAKGNYRIALRGGEKELVIEGLDVN